MFKKCKNDIEIIIPKSGIIDSFNGERKVYSQRWVFSWMTAFLS
jgi:hypothetical protein